MERGKFLCENSNPIVYCFKERQKCKTSNGVTKCVCEEGWSGKACSVHIDDDKAMSQTAKSPTPTPLNGMCNVDHECKTPNSICIDKQCQCKPGFSPRKDSCINQNECSNHYDNGCDFFAECIDTEGSYECKCKDGYADANVATPGRQCKQKNECLTGEHDCDGDTEVCIDKRPPEKWECVERTPAPTKKPTKKPAQIPKPTQTSNICYDYIPLCEENCANDILTTPVPGGIGCFCGYFLSGIQCGDKIGKPCIFTGTATCCQYTEQELNQACNQAN
jgi:hypothetical protein